jgi:M6 family metalloprotease-like protein
MVYFPYNARCDFGGLGTTGDRYTWVNGEMTSRVAAHELGHNLGLHHSSSATCTNAKGAQVTVSAKCTHDEYGDLFDAMGAVYTGVPREFNAAQKSRLGWLDGRTATVTTSRSVTLSPLEGNTGVVAAKIVAGASEYWIEYRRPVGVDTSLGFYPGSTDGVLVHRTTKEGATELLDGRPDGYKSFANAAVPAGSSVTTPEGVTAKVRSANGSSAIVDIMFARAPK